MKQLKAHFFDMDHTLINADCDVTWKEFMVAEKQAPESDLAEAERFFEDYNRGELDTEEFQKFQLREFIGKTPQEMAYWCDLHFEKVIRKQVYAKAYDLIQKLKKDGFFCGILTSTNREIARSVAEYFGVDAFFGTELELADGKFTGRVQGTFMVGEGKPVVLENFCRTKNWSIKEVAYYGDSINDRFVLDACGEAHAVNASDDLKKLALAKGWEIGSFAD